MVSVGGYFASLKLITDENSFRKGVDTLGKFPGLLKGTVMGAVGLAAGMVALATTTATAMSKLDAQARTLGMSARNLDNWRGAVSLAGGDADGFVASMVNMNEAFRNLKIGEVKTDFIQATGMSGANFAALQGMDNDTRLRTIWSALEKVADKDKQQALVEKIFGSGGVELFSLLRAKGQTLAGNYNTAASLNPLTNADYRTAIEGDKAQREITQSLEKQFQNVGISIENALLPSLDKLAKWFATHQTELDAFATAVGDATSTVIGFFSWMTKSQSQQQHEGRAWILGGDKFATAFEGLAKRKGIDLNSDTTGAGLALMMGSEWSRLSKAIKTNKVPDDQLAKISESGARSTLFEAGRTDLAYKLSDDAIKALQDSANRKFAALFPGLGKADPNSEAYQGLLRSQVTETARTLKIEISSSGAITDNQAKMIGDAIVKNAATSGLK